MQLTVDSITNEFLKNVWELLKIEFIKFEFSQ